MDFEEIYANRPDPVGVGSSGRGRMKHLYDICMEVQPTHIIESGTWKGNSSYLFRQACPNATLHCYDISFENLRWSDTDSGSLTTYFEKDIELSDISTTSDKSEVLIFFDDHINQARRLDWCKRHNFIHVVFDDNIPPEELHLFKLPPTPTLAMLKVDNKLPEWVKKYKVFPFVDEKKNTHLTRVEIDITISHRKEHETNPKNNKVTALDVVLAEHPEINPQQNWQRTPVKLTLGEITELMVIHATNEIAREKKTWYKKLFRKLTQIGLGNMSVIDYKDEVEEKVLGKQC